MKYINSSICCFLLLGAFSVNASAQSWMKQDNPDSLGLYVRVSDDCPITKEELTKRIEGEFLRARIKPTRSLSLNITVEVLCLSIAQGSSNTVRGHAVNYGIRFGATMEVNHFLYDGPNHGSLLIVPKGSNQYLLDAIRDSVSNALTDYLKANFG